MGGGGGHRQTGRAGELDTKVVQVRKGGCAGGFSLLFDMLINGLFAMLINGGRWEGRWGRRSAQGGGLDTKVVQVREGLCVCGLSPSVGIKSRVGACGGGERGQAEW